MHLEKKLNDIVIEPGNNTKVICPNCDEDNPSTVGNCVWCEYSLPDTAANSQTSQPDYQAPYQVQAQQPHNQLVDGTVRQDTARRDLTAVRKVRLVKSRLVQFILLSMLGLVFAGWYIITANQEVSIPSWSVSAKLDGFGWEQTRHQVLRGIGDAQWVTWKNNTRSEVFTLQRLYDDGYTERILYLFREVPTQDWDNFTVNKYGLFHDFTAHTSEGITKSEFEDFPPGYHIMQVQYMVHTPVSSMYTVRIGSVESKWESQGKADAESVLANLKHGK